MITPPLSQLIWQNGTGKRLEKDCGRCSPLFSNKNASIVDTDEMTHMDTQHWKGWAANRWERKALKGSYIFKTKKNKIRVQCLDIFLHFPFLWCVYGKRHKIAIEMNWTSKEYGDAGLRGLERQRVGWWSIKFESKQVETDSTIWFSENNASFSAKYHFEIWFESLNEKFTKVGRLDGSCDATYLIYQKSRVRYMLSK